MKLDLYTRLHLWLVAHRRWVFAALALIIALGPLISTRYMTRV